MHGEKYYISYLNGGLRPLYVIIKDINCILII